MACMSKTARSASDFAQYGNTWRAWWDDTSWMYFGGFALSLFLQRWRQQCAGFSQQLFDKSTPGEQTVSNAHESFQQRVMV